MTCFYFIFPSLSLSIFTKSKCINYFVVIFLLTTINSKEETEKENERKRQKEKIKTPEIELNNIFH